METPVLIRVLVGIMVAVFALMALTRRLYGLAIGALLIAVAGVGPLIEIVQGFRLDGRVQAPLLLLGILVVAFSRPRKKHSQAAREDL